MEVKLYVGNLAYKTSEEDLLTLFAQAGTVTSVALIKDRITGQSKGFAFVKMTTQAEAQKAIDMFNAYSLADRELKVNVAQPRETQGGYQSALGTFASTGRELKVKTTKLHSLGPIQSGYQSRFSAFSNNGSQHGPTSPRRRGSNQRH
jgi:cold-inducible RNA-binding protein